MNRCRIHPPVDPPAAELVERLRRLPTTAVSDQLERTGAVAGLRRITSPDLGILAGPAFTVRTRPGDNLAIYKAIELARDGEVLVVDAGGATDRAVIGEIVYRHAISRGIGGLVIDGVIRDGEEIAAGRLPIFARGFTHAGPYKNGPGELRGPVSVGDAVVRQGDLVVGDGDGVAVVPVDRLEQVLAGGERQLEREQDMIRLADEGKLDTSWLDDQIEIEWVDAAGG